MKAPKTYSIILMGVAGSGKTTIGKELESLLGYKFHDADDFHSPKNINKMKNGIALTDNDRSDWLAELNDLLIDHEPIILACSALKSKYRYILAKNTKCRFIYLKISINAVVLRLKARSGHYFNTSLIETQFSTLEEPKTCIVIDAEKSVSEIISNIKSKLAYQ
jgi:gluconokinase